MYTNKSKVSVSVCMFSNIHLVSRRHLFIHSLNGCLVRNGSSSLIGGGRLINTMLSVMLSITVLTNEWCYAWSDYFLVLESK